MIGASNLMRIFWKHWIIATKPPIARISYLSSTKEEGKNLKSKTIIARVSISSLMVLRTKFGLPVTEFLKVAVIDRSTTGRPAFLILNELEIRDFIQTPLKSDQEAGRNENLSTEEMRKL